MASITPASSQPTGESFAALFEESLNRKEMRVGEVITAEVVSVDENFVVVNAGLKSESVIAVDEFRNDAGEVDVKAGDFVRFVSHGPGKSAFAKPSKTIAACRN